MKCYWFEEYTCGCVSDEVPAKRDLLGYCPKHGEPVSNRYKMVADIDKFNAMFKNAREPEVKDADRENL